MKAELLLPTLKKHSKERSYLYIDDETGEAWVAATAIHYGIELMGGFEGAASLLNVDEEVLCSWLYTQHVPAEFRPVFMKLTDYEDFEFSASPVYILLPERVWWPHEPTPDQLAAAEAFYC